MHVVIKANLTKRISLGRKRPSKGVFLIDENWWTIIFVSWHSSCCMGFSRPDLQTVYGQVACAGLARARGGESGFVIKASVRKNLTAQSAALRAEKKEGR
jgi:hypothetical protein